MAVVDNWFFNRQYKSVNQRARVHNNPFKRGYSYLALIALSIGARSLQVVPGLRYEVGTKTWSIIGYLPYHYSQFLGIYKITNTHLISRHTHAKMRLHAEYDASCSI